MKRLVPFTVLIFLGAHGFADVLESPQFLTTVQFAVNEIDARRVPEEQNRIRVYFSKTLEGWPQLKRQPVEVRTLGNEVVFYLTSDTDIHEPMQQALSVFVHDLNGKVQMRGRAEVSALSKPMAGYRVEVDRKRRRLEGATARSAPLLDLLKDVKKQLVSFSYSVTGPCGKLPISWNYVPSPNPKVNTVEEAMSELASIAGLKLDSHGGTYFEFTGQCAVGNLRSAQPEGLPIVMPASNILFAPATGGERPYVYVPLRMLSE